MKYKDEFYGTYEFRKQARKDMVPWLNVMKPDAFITLNFNRETTHAGARNCLGDFLARLDRYQLGPRWMKLPHKRTDVIAFPENVRTNYHFHLIGTLPPKTYDMCQVTLMKWIDKSWKSIVVSGSTDFDFNRYDKDVLADYVTKDLLKKGGIETFISSREFW